MQIIDTHQHLWDLTKFNLPWQSDASPTLAQSYLMSDYMASIAGTDIVKSVYMEVDVAPEQQQAEAEFVVDLCSRDDNPMCAAIISGRPGQEGFRDYIAGLKQHECIKGVRQVLHTPATPTGYALEDSFLADMVWLGEQGLSFDLCMRRDELPDAVRIADECPDTTFVLDHCGNADLQADAVDDDAWRRDIDIAARCKNLFCKVSGFIWTLDTSEEWSSLDIEPVVDHVFECFGPDRVMFGGDWPVCTQTVTLAQWVETLQQAVSDRSEEDQRKLFYDNATRIYRLS